MQSRTKKEIHRKGKYQKLAVHTEIEQRIFNAHNMKRYIPKHRVPSFRLKVILYIFSQIKVN